MEQHHTFPTDLVQAQIAFHRAYRALAANPHGSPTARRRQMLRLAAQIFFHHYWTHVGGRSRLEGLRRHARALEQTQAA